MTICAVEANKMAAENFLDAMVIMSSFKYDSHFYENKFTVR
jgi:hypothetical protein